MTTKNLPRWVANKLQQNYTADEIRLIDENLHTFHEPDWSESDWSELCLMFNATLHQLAIRGTLPTVKKGEVVTLNRPRDTFPIVQRIGRGPAVETVKVLAVDEDDDFRTILWERVSDGSRGASTQIANGQWVRTSLDEAEELFGVNPQ
jgi:hypothetical protein